jgi:hypothetical protein
VRVILKNKKMVTGVIDSVSPTEIALIVPSGDSVPLVIPGERVDRVEQKSGSPGRTVVGVAIIGALATAL